MFSFATAARVMTRRLRFAPAAAAVILAILPGMSLAGSISLAWDPVQDPDLAGYRVFVGTTPGGTDQAVLDVGQSTQATITGLPDCTEFYIGVKAVDLSGQESPGFSGFVQGMTAPKVDDVSPDSIDQGAEDVQLTVTGAGFTDMMQRTDLSFDEADVRVLDIEWVSCTELELIVSAGPFISNPGDPGYNGAGGVFEEVPPAEIGSRGISVAAPDPSGLPIIGSSSAFLEVDFVPERTDADGSGRVDGFDLARLARAFGSSVEFGGPYDADVDLDGDNAVDGLDLSLLANYFTLTF